jgi:hypothetical protein
MEILITKEYDFWEDAFEDENGKAYGHRVIALNQTINYHK